MNQSADQHVQEEGGLSLPRLTGTADEIGPLGIHAQGSSQCCPVQPAGLTTGWTLNGLQYPSGLHRANTMAGDDHPLGGILLQSSAGCDLSEPGEYPEGAEKPLEEFESGKLRGWRLGFQTTYGEKVIDSVTDPGLDATGKKDCYIDLYVYLTYMEYKKTENASKGFDEIMKRADGKIKDFRLKYAKRLCPSGECPHCTGLQFVAADWSGSSHHAGKADFKVVRLLYKYQCFSI
jgi:hypothetical protein